MKLKWIKKGDRLERGAADSIKTMGALELRVLRSHDVAAVFMIYDRYDHH